MPERESSGDVIRASEIGEYVYCHRAWWLGRVRGVPNANRVVLGAGITRHRAHGRQMQRSEWLQRGAWLLFAIAILAALLLLVRLAALG